MARRFPKWVREFPGALWAFEARRAGREKAEAQALAARHGTALAAAVTPAALRRSDTLFVLGSGGSIAGYGPAQWDEIAAHDSAGFNNWYLHPFVPSFYFYEGGIEDYTRVFVQNTSRLDSSFFRIPFFLGVRDHNELILEAADTDWKAQIHLSPVFYLRARSRAELAVAYGALARGGGFREGAVYARGVTQTASLDRILHFACLAGYKQIVLCGVDLTSSAYFFNVSAETKASYEARGLVLPNTGAVQTGAVHNTASQGFARITVMDVLEILRRQILGPRGITLKVALPSSGLYPALPAYFEESGANPIVT